MSERLERSESLDVTRERSDREKAIARV